MDLEFRRKAYDQMLEWKHSMSNRYAFLIENARCVSKTQQTQKFIKREYEQVGKITYLPCL